METYLVYIGKTAIVSGAFYLAYMVMFQNRKQFTYNRIYLPAALLLSFLIPMVTFTSTAYVVAPAVHYSSVTYQEHIEWGTIPAEPWSWWPHYLFGLYLAGVACFFIFLITGHIKAFRIIRQSSHRNLFGYRVNITEKDVHPFSFFNKIIIPQNTLNCPNLRMIVEHEQIHVREKHTADILLAEILFMLQWFNPFAWLIRGAVKANLEYKTDNEIIKHHNPETYQLAMVAQANKKDVAPFLTALNGSQLKERIVMMQKKQENRFVLLKQLVIVALLALLVMGFSEHKVIKKYIHEPHGLKEQIAAGLEMSVPEVHMDSLPAGLLPQNTRYPSVDVQEAISLEQPDTTVSTEPSVTTLEPDSAKHPIFVVDGKISANIIQVPPQDIISVEILKEQAATERFGADGKNGAVVLTTKSKQYEYLDDNAQNVRPIPEDQVTPPEVWPEFPGGEEALRRYIAENINYPEIARENGIHGTAYVSFSVTKEGKVTNVRLARGIYQPLDQEALRVVQSLPDWKPGTTNGQPVDVKGFAVPVYFVLENPVVKVKSFDESVVIPGPVYFVDGKVTRSIKDISPDNIGYIEVLDKATSKAIYGNWASDGVIIITTKQGIGKSKIITQRQLMQFFATNISYPVKALQSGVAGVTGIIIDPRNSNRLVKTDDNYRGNVFQLPRVEVTGYTGAEVRPSQSEEYTSEVIKEFFKEIDRVRQMLPEVDIPGLEGKMIGISFEFVLKNGK